MTNSMNMGARGKKKSEKDNWQTPPDLLSKISEFMPGWFDPCPGSPTFDGLSIEWPSPTFINPPFSKYRQWAKYGAAQDGEQVWICHHSHDTKWFKALFARSKAIALLHKRVEFLKPSTGKSTGTAIGKCQSLIYVGKNLDDFQKVFSTIAYVLKTNH